MSSGGKTQTVTQSSGPWAGQQPYLSDAFDIARQNLAASSNGQIGQYYPGQTYTSADWRTNDATSEMYNRGTLGGTRQGVAGEAATGWQAQNLLNNGVNALPGSGTQYALANGSYSDPGGDLFYQRAAGMPTSATQLAGGSTLMNTAAGGGMNANPYQSAIVQQAVQAARPTIDSAFAATGRLGSGAYGNAMADAATNAAAQIGYQNYATERQNQLAAAGTLNNQDLATQGMALGGLQNLAQYGQQNRAAQLAAAQGLNSQGLQAMGLGGTLAGQASQNDANNLNAMFGAGQITENYGDKALTDAINRWNYQQNLPWQNLANYTGIVNGTYGGSSTTTQPVYGNSALSGVFGGASAAGGLLSGLGQIGSLFK